MNTINIVGGKGAVNEDIYKFIGKAGFDVDRLGGKNRYDTSVTVAEHLGLKGVTGLWIATGADFPDALSASVLAAQPDQRLVLSHEACIPGPVVPEWIRGKNSEITQVTLVGGTGVLSTAVQNLTPCAR